LLNNEQEEEDEYEAPLEYTHQYKFTIHSPYPRMEYEPDQTKKIYDIKSLWPSATLVVDTVDEDEDEEEA
jgi:FAS-associated factor 2